MSFLDKRLNDMSRDELIVALQRAYQVIWEIDKKNEELLVKVDNLSHEVYKPLNKKGVLRSFAHAVRDFFRVLRRKR